MRVYSLLPGVWLTTLVLMRGDGSNSTSPMFSTTRALRVVPFSEVRWPVWFSILWTQPPFCPSMRSFPWVCIFPPRPLLMDFDACSVMSSLEKRRLFSWFCIVAAAMVSLLAAAIFPLLVRVLLCMAMDACVLVSFAAFSMALGEVMVSFFLERISWGRVMGPLVVMVMSPTWLVRWGVLMPTPSSVAMIRMCPAAMRLSKREASMASWGGGPVASCRVFRVLSV